MYASEYTSNEVGKSFARTDRIVTWNMFEIS